MKDCEKYKALLMGLMDNELTPEELHEINSHLEKCAACREEYEQLRQTANRIETVSLKEPQDEMLRKIWKSPYSRFIRFTGLFLALSGWLVLLFFGIIEMLRDNSEPALPRIAVTAMIVGFVLLLAYVIWERISTYQSDPYKEVER